MLNYESLSELPIYNWWHCINKSDVRYLLKVYDVNFKGNLDDLFLKFHQEYLDIFGAGDETEHLLSLYKKKIDYMYNIMMGQRWYKNHIKTIDGEIEMFNRGKGSTQTLEQICVILSKHQGYRVDPKITTVIEFGEIIKLLQNGNESNKRN
jgi:hypothetical protein